VGFVRRECRRGDLFERVERRRLYARDVPPESLVWKERVRGRLRMFESAWKEADGVGRLSSRMAAMVCDGLACLQ
jgi:hypothetical protein